MTECLLDPDLFCDAKDARKALAQHQTYLKANQDIIILGNTYYFQELRKRIKQYCDPGTRSAFLGILNKMWRLKPLSLRPFEQETHDPGYFDSKCLISFLRLSGQIRDFSKKSLSQMAPEYSVIIAKYCAIFHDPTILHALNSAI